MQNFFSANRMAFYILGFLAFLALFYALFLNAPNDFAPEATVKIEEGMSLRAVSLLLKNESIIRSRIAFEAFIILFGGEKHIMYYDYLFENKLPVYEVATRILKGEHHMPSVVVTVPEGFDISQIAEAMSLKLINFNKDKFLVKATAQEGYLFPDTYFFLNINDEQEVLNSMSKNFEKKILSLEPNILASGKTEKDIIIMASLIEREAKGDADRGFISGILWKRITLGIPLQVDAFPETYKIKGLPKNPICNPGLEAIKAAIEPRITPYLYYLHDKNGNIHYAKNFAEHKANKLKYLTQ